MQAAIRLKGHLLFLVAVFFSTGFRVLPALAQSPTVIHVDAAQPGPAISPLLHGVFFEDINFAADGGLYPERIKNRSFEFSDPLMGWRKVEKGSAVGGLGISTEKPLNANNPHYLRILIEAPGDGFGLTNEGFRGIGVSAGEKFTFSTYARAKSETPVELSVILLDSHNKTLGQAEININSPDWKQVSCPINSSAAEGKAKLSILVKTKGTVDLDMVSLFPEQTFKHRPNGLRSDLAQLVADLKPGFVRFPGGCIVEGRTLANRYQWKNTIGPLAERMLIMNRWNSEFPQKAAPDYFQSYGLGFFEYFQFCEDIGAQPLPILNCGMGCQFNSGDLCPVDQLQPYIQDALDLIEFANGPAESTWGAKRAAMGHPQPFGMTMLGVGNEQWGPQYFERYALFAKALKEKHPEIKVVSSSGPNPDGDKFDFNWKKIRELGADFVDEHFYKEPAWFYSQINRYDKYDRSGPKIFAGEFAATTKNRKNNWEAALAEAAFRIGLERNGDVVAMSSYAPLLAHVDAWQWGPDLIWFDSVRSFGTPNYYVAKLFGNNLGSSLLSFKLEGAGEGVYACAEREDKSGEIILKVVNASAEARKVQLDIAGTDSPGTSATLDVLGSDDLSAENSLDEPTKTSPVHSTLESAGKQFDHTFPARSVSVIRWK